MRMVLILSGIMLLMTNVCHAAKIYKWRGPDGQIHYSSTPPPEVEAETTQIKTTRGKPKPEQGQGDELNLEGLSDEEKIKALQDKLNKEKIRELEEKIKALEEGRNVSDTKVEKPVADKQGEDDAAMDDEPKGPDYSVQGQVRMLQEAKRVEAMKTRCRAKAPHGVDCSKAENYERY